MSDLTLAPEGAVQLFETLFCPGDLVLLRLIESYIEGGKKTDRVIWNATTYGTLTPHDEHEGKGWETFLASAEKEMANVFFGVCPRMGADGHYDLAWQIRTVRVLWTDLDHCSADEARERIRKQGLPDLSALVGSGHGCHGYWLLDSPYLIDDVPAPPAVYKEFLDQGPGKKRKPLYYIKDKNGDRIYQYLSGKNGKPSKTFNPLWPTLSLKARHAQDVMAGIASCVGGDHTKDLARLLRVPGTLNRKNQRGGADPTPCVLVECDPNRVYPFSTFERFATQSPDRARREKVAKLHLPSPVKMTPGRTTKLGDMVNACSIAKDRSSADWALVCWAIEKGIPRAEVWKACSGVGKFEERGEDYFNLTWEKAEGHTREQIYDRAVAKEERRSGTTPARAPTPSSNGHAPHGLNGDAGGGGPPPDEEEGEGGGLPRIETNDRQLRDVSDEAVRALLATNSPPWLFQSGGLLSRLRREEESGLLAIEHITTNALRGHLARVADWVQGMPEGDLNVSPPEEIAKDINSLPCWPGVPHLRRVVHCPVYTASGELVITPGYHAGGRIYYEPAAGLVIPPVPSAPSPAQVQQAVCLILEDLYGEFPFVDQPSRAHALALVLLPFVRAMINGPTPLHVVDAPSPGTGKGLLVNCAGVIANGEELEAIAETDNNEEWRKRIFAALLSGSSYLLLDNLNSVLDTSALASVLTTRVIKDRVLGFSRMGCARNETGWVATGNNVKLSGEMTRRSVLIRQDAKSANPWKGRKFKHPLPGWAFEHRGELVAAVLTIVNGWLAAGRPQGAGDMGTFEAWVGVVGGIIQHAGVPGFLGNAGDLAERADPLRGQWETFVDAWWKRYQAQEVTTGELYDEVVERNDLLPDVLGPARRTAFSDEDHRRKIKLGRLIGEKRETVVGSHRIEVPHEANGTAKKDKSGRSLFSLSFVGAGGPAAPAAPPCPPAAGAGPPAPQVPQGGDGEWQEDVDPEHAHDNEEETVF